MVTALRGVLIGYAVMWAVLLIACLRKREFCPIFSDSRRTRLFWLATFVLVNPLLTILYLVFGQLRPPQARPVRAVRDIVVVIAIAGFFLNIPGLTHLWMQPFMGRSASAGETIEEPRFQAKAAVIEAANNTSSTSMTGSFDNSRLACRRMAVIVEDEHPLLSRIGSALAKQLEAIPAVETVDLHGNGIFPEPGQRAPDVFIRLHLADLQETPIPYSLKLQARIGADVGQAPLASTHHYSDTFSPPALNFHTNIQMTHTSTTTGYESIRYSMAAENIAKDLGGQIAKAFEQWKDKYGLLPEFPAEFYGDYIDYDLPEPLTRLEPEVFGSYAGLLTHNETYLQFTVTGDPCEPVQSVRDAMVASGWKELSGNWKASNINLRLEKDNRRIHIFQVRPRRPFSGVMVITRLAESVPTHLFGISDTQSFSYDQRRVALDGLLTEPYALEHLMLFERMFDKPQQRRWLEILESLPARDVFAQIRLGELYQRRDLPEKAAEALRLAKALLWAEQDKSRYRSRIKNLAKQLGDEKLADIVPERQDFLNAGFTELALGVAPVELEADLNVPLLTFFTDHQGQFRTFSVTVAPSDDPGSRFSIRSMQSTAHGSSWGTRGGGHWDVNEPWRYDLSTSFNEVRVTCPIRQIGTEDRFSMSVSINQE